MAVVRAKTSASYGVIIFLVFLLVVVAAIAVMFYMKTEKLETTAVVARKALDKLGTDADVAAVKSAARFGGNKDILPLREALNEVDTLRTKIAGGGPGAGTDVPAVPLVPDMVEDKLSKLGLSKDQSLLGALDTLVTARDQAETRAKTAEANLATAQGSNTSDRGNYDTERAAWQKSLQQLGQEKDQLTTQVQAAQKEHKDAITTYEGKIDKLETEKADLERKKAEALKKKEEEIAAKQEEVLKYKAQLAIFKPKNPADISNETDGRIIRVAPNSDIVYVNVGSADHATRGLTFAVYDPKFNISDFTIDDASGEKRYHEKASLELVEVSTHESMARITHTEKDQAVAVGDAIANPVFHADRSRKFHFFIYGKFDLSGDNGYTPSERDQLERMIRNWNGIIDEELSPQTDFLVLGLLPSTPVTIKGIDPTMDWYKAYDNIYHTDAKGHRDVLDPENPEDKLTIEKLKGEFKTVTDYIAKAHDFSIPVLNSNRFLAMIGYYNTTVIQHPLFRAAQ